MELRQKLYDIIVDLDEDEFKDAIDNLFERSGDECYHVFRMDELDDEFTASEILDCDLTSFDYSENYFVDNEYKYPSSFDNYRDAFIVSDVVDDYLINFDNDEIIKMFEIETHQTTVIYDGYWYGEPVSEYGLQNGCIDYSCLSRVVGSMVLCNEMRNRLGDTLAISDDCQSRDEWNDLEEPVEIYQWFIIDDEGAKVLERWTNEFVFYDDELDVYVWGVTHFGTSWSYVLTDIEIANNVK